MTGENWLRPHLSFSENIILLFHTDLSVYRNPSNTSCLLHGSINYLHEKVTVITLIFLHRAESFHVLLAAFLVLKSAYFILCFQVRESFSHCFFSFGVVN